MSMTDRIRERIEELGLTAKGASLAAGLNDTYVRDLLKSADPNPRLNHIKALAKVLKVSVEWLDTGQDTSNIIDFAEMKYGQRQELLRYAEYLKDRAADESI